MNLTLKNKITVHNDIEQVLGYRFKDKAILREALTHKSFAGERRGVKHNERLEFLGDSIIGAIVAEYIYKQCPHEEEGVLSKIKSNLVSRHNLYLWAKQLELGLYMNLGHGELATGGRERDSILSNAMEAIIGALYLDGGKNAVETFVANWMTSQPLEQDSGDYKSRLQEHIQKKTQSTPSYEVLQTVGPEHAKIFTVQVCLDGKKLGVGKGRNKKLAEQAAAQDAYGKLVKNVK